SVAMQASFRGLDGGYGWVITLGSFISFMVEGAFERGEGIMYPYFLQRFQASNQLTTLPCAMASTLRFLFSPLASMVCNRYSIRASVMFGGIVFTLGVFLSQFADSILVLLFTYGVLTGYGRAFFSGPSLVVIGLYFRRRQGLASGLALSGVGFGSFLLVPLIDYLLKTYGFQGAFLVLSGVAANMLVVAMLYRPLSTNNRYLAVGAKRKGGAAQRAGSGSNTSLVRDKAFMFYCITTFFFTGNFKVVLVFLPTLVQSKGFTLQDAALMLSLTGLIDVAARIGFGFLLDVELVGRYRMVMFNCVLLCMSVTAAVMPLMETFPRLFAALVLYALCASLYLTSRTVVLMDLIGEQQLSNAFGILMFCQGFGTLLSPPLAGLLLDLYGNIRYGYFLA
ncbi:hypothetical protein EGW08_022918, partial [Elysia chlorotica]